MRGIERLSTPDRGLSHCAIVENFPGLFVSAFGGAAQSASMIMPLGLPGEHQAWKIEVWKWLRFHQDIHQVLQKKNLASRRLEPALPPTGPSDSATGVLFLVLTGRRQ